jgi:hypothetical protein
MHSIFRGLLGAAVFLALVSGRPSSSIFHDVKVKSGEVGRYGRFELSVGLDSVYTNPYDYSDVAVRCVFVSPSGKHDTVDAFYTTDYRIDTATGKLSLAGLDGAWGAASRRALGHFAVRYSPRVTGSWSYSLFAETRTMGRVAGPHGRFRCLPSNSPGFVRRNASPYLSFDGDSTFIPIGENLGWAGRDPYLDYRRWITRLAANKGNFIRVWMPSWGLGLEWQKGRNGYEGIGRYKQSNAALLDWLLDYCEEKGVYVMLSLDHHGQVSSKVDPNWSENPYNAANGGPCVHTWDFFTDTVARHWIANRFRYITARYGYSPNIMAWELFNEVDWTDDFSHHRADVAGWHAEMAALLRRLDVNRHLITTSYGMAVYDSLVWRLPAMDFTQTHYYTLKPLDSVLSAGNAHYLSAYGKPTLNGEFGLSGDGRPLAANDPGGIYVHNALWGSMLSGAMGPGLSWWWDNYIDPQDLYVHFNGLAAFVAGVDWRGGGYAPVEVRLGVGSAGALGAGGDSAAALGVGGGSAALLGVGCLRAYVLRSRDSMRVAGWVLNGGYTAARLKANEVPAAVAGGVLTVPGMRDGGYRVSWVDCKTGRVMGTENVAVKDGTLRVTCPAVRWDVAVKVEPIGGGK